jgi:hypothetical protein
MRKFALTALASAAVLTACGAGAPKTEAELLLGEWDQVAPVTIMQDGQTVMISEGAVKYDADGTGEGIALMTISSLPVEINAYSVKADTTYTLTDSILTEAMVNATVTAQSDSEQAAQLAEMIQAGMVQAPASSSTIVSIDANTLVLRENESGAEITYKRD